MDKSTSILQLFEEFDKVTRNVEDLRFAISAMERTESKESVSYTADDTNVVIGEVFYVKSPGRYKVVTKGSGKGSFLIKTPDTNLTLCSGRLDDNQESELLTLTYGDICYFHASADINKTIVISLVEQETLFEMMSTHLDEIETQVKSVDTRIDNLIANEPSINAYYDGNTLVISDK